MGHRTQGGPQSADENPMTDRQSHAETRRLDRELRSPLPANGQLDVGIDDVDELRDLWDGLVAESMPVEPAVGSVATPVTPGDPLPPLPNRRGRGEDDAAWP